MSDTNVATVEQDEMKTEAAAVEPMQKRETYLPLADIKDHEETVVVAMDMPGVSRESVDVTVDKDVLTITGKLEAEGPRADWKAIWHEYPEGNYKRSFRLAGNFETNQINAVMKHGVLTLSLPKKKELTPQKITVSSN
ncbi:MAG: Hsp20/alpha crystallin family protein [Candidatus Nitrohelix vancouverensis]|uniref:Hsp20/alpha crystallin family protein n=1 Tax=Candidatus Nitrohelix vancouverensis TaxID=2705534 RepID=A0A7T0C4M9_9BACT|nr:MAG: Hsp20/alpha crystallin family protein [Candidatus Nitrohelix vancouverensis]